MIIGTSTTPLLAARLARLLPLPLNAPDTAAGDGARAHRYGTHCAAVMAPTLCCPTGGLPKGREGRVYSSKKNPIVPFGPFPILSYHAVVTSLSPLLLRCGQCTMLALK